MRRAPLFLLAALLALSSCARDEPAPRPGSAAGGASTFEDAEGLFSASLPAGWRSQVDSTAEGPITTFTDGTAYVSVMAGRVDLTAVAPQLRARVLEEGAQPYFQGWLNALRGMARVQARPVVQTRAFGVPGLRLNVAYRRRGVRGPRTGYALFVQGNRAVYFITATAPSRAFPAADRVVAALRLGGAP